MAKATRNRDGSTSMYLKTCASPDVKSMETVQHGMESFLHSSAAVQVAQRTSTSPSFYKDAVGCGTIPDDPIDRMRLAMDYAFRDPVAGRTIQLMAQLSQAGFRHKCKVPWVGRWFDEWAKQVKLSEVNDWLFLDYYRVGNVPVYRFQSPYIPQGDYPTKASRNVAMKKSMARGSIIPARYTTLNPLAIDVKGAPEFGAFEIRLKVDEDTLKLLRKKQVSEFISKQLPTEVLEIDRRSEFADIKPENVRMIYRMKAPYESWAAPLMTPAFPAIHHKFVLQEMDYRTAQNFINKIIKVTIGDDRFPPTEGDLQKLAKIFQNPGSVLTLFWNHTLKVEFVEPRGDILSSEKYEHVDDEIRRAFGISEVLLGSADKSFGMGAISVKGFVENLEQGRQKIGRFWQEEEEEIARIMGLPCAPEIEWDYLSLRDEAKMISVLLRALQFGVISYKSLMAKLGLDFDQQVEEMAQELELIDDGILGRKIGTPGVNGVDLEGKRVGGKRVVKEDKGLPAEPGRPDGEPGDYPEIRDPGIASKSVHKCPRCPEERATAVALNAHMIKSHRAANDISRKGKLRSRHHTRARR